MDDSREIRDRQDDAGAPSAERQSRADAPARDRGDAPIRERPPAEQKPREAAPRDGRDAGGDQGGDRGGGKQQGRKRHSRLPLIALGIFIVIAAAGGTWYWWSTRNLQDTDDAYTDGRSVQISPRIAGQVVQLAVHDNEFVHAGDLLVAIDPRDSQAALDRAQAAYDVAKAQVANAELGAEIAKQIFPARLASAKAQLAAAQATQFRADADLRRQVSVARGATSQQNIDDARAAALQAAAQVKQAEASVQEATPVQPNIAQSAASVKQLGAALEQAQANLEQARLNLSYTRVVAPQDGWVTQRNVEMGDYLKAGQQIMALVAPEVWVTANFKETELTRIRPGQHVNIHVDAYPGLKLQGHVDSIQKGSGAQFSAFPAENATGNFVKIVRRVPVKIGIDSGLDPHIPLPLGISVEPTIHLK
jgi:membrane fusion protein (multidrug efflux system)